MPRYFFHSEDGEFRRDQEGSELPSAAAARLEAVRMLGEMLRDRPAEFWDTGQLAVIVEAEGHPRFVLRVTTELGPEHDLSTAHRDE